MTFADKCAFGQKNNFSSICIHVSETDLGLVYFVVKITCAKIYLIKAFGRRRWGESP